MFKTVHLKAHTLEDNFGTRGHRDLLEKCVDRCRVESRGQEGIELDWQEPKRADIELASLEGIRYNNKKEMER